MTLEDYVPDNSLRPIFTVLTVKTVNDVKRIVNMDLKGFYMCCQAKKLLRQRRNEFFFVIFTTLTVQDIFSYLRPPIKYL